MAMNYHRQITSTFSIIGIDPLNEELGIAVATNEIGVGNSTVHIEKGVGAISIIADTDVRYGIEGLDLLRKGYDAEECLQRLLASDDQPYIRQVGIIAADGSKAVHNGSSIKHWKGSAGVMMGEHYIVMGNALEEGVLKALSQTFEQSSGPLGLRLLQSLMAGQQAGGQIDGKQSAALKVLGKHTERSHQTDLRVDYSSRPFRDLKKLANFHFGRLTVLKAIDCLVDGELSEGRRLLVEGEKNIGEWLGVQEELILAYMVLGDADQAVRLIEDALFKEPKWAVNLPAFHLLKDHPKLKGLIKEDDFEEKDWIRAIDNYLAVNELDLAIQACENANAAFPQSSALPLACARILLSKGQIEETLAQLEISVQLDVGNKEAQQLKEKLMSHSLG